MARFHFALVGLVLLIAQPLLAKTYYVGSCKTGAYPTIGAAVAGVPAGSTIDVCPGTYPEQVVISQPLTLQGFASGGSAQAVITMPSSGTTTTSLKFGTVAAQVEVTSGPVNITGITVDGRSSTCPGVQPVGIFYASGSSGTLNEVETQFQYCEIPGIGILAENGSGVATTVTIENSNTNLSGYAGIYVCSPAPSTLNANIKNNYLIENLGYGIATDCNTTATVSDNVVWANGANEGIILMAPSSKVTGNTVTGAQTGIFPVASGAIVSGNTITGFGAGIWLDGAATVTSNHISNGTFGIVIAVPGSTIQTNFMSQVEIGINFQCVTATVSGNTIAGSGENSPGTGFAQFPGTSTGTNKFYNVATLTTGCS
ncbi:MAG: right-handed parallel beta-helix repeat-containing protein [Terriglobales bacterium]